MQVECPSCGAVATIEQVRLRKGEFRWECPGCRRVWEVRTVFFEDAGTRLKDLGGTTKSLRVEQGMTQAQLGELIGVTAAYISHIEGGKRIPAPSLTRRLLEALGAHEEAAKV